MCGRYYYDDETTREIEKLVQQISRNYRQGDSSHGDLSHWESSHGEPLSHGELLSPGEISPGEISPCSMAPVITSHDRKLTVAACQWGFPKFKGSGVIFNARAETALEKNMFRRSLQERRCIIPAKHFYEWDKGKNKIAFFHPSKPAIYMAGFYNSFPDGVRYVILTTAANISMQDVHDRMPVMVADNEVADWIYDDVKMMEILHRTPYRLSRETSFAKKVKG